MIMRINFLGENMTNLEEYYNKFNEDKRLKSRHGQVEFIITMEYIDKYLDDKVRSICDIGCGAGAYSIPLARKGYDVTSFDFVKYNLGILSKHAKEQNLDIKALKRDARRLKVDDNISDLTLLLGPMYHLHSLEDKKKALSEAIRITKPGGRIFVGYVMNDYGVLIYGFKEKHILENINEKRVDEFYHIKTNENDLYDYVRLEDIYDINNGLEVEREVIFSPDGPANHMRQVLNALSNEEFEEFIKYQKSVCERNDLMGASAHTVDVLRVVK